MADEEIQLRLDVADSAEKAKALDRALDGVEKSAEGAAGAGDKLTKSGGNSALAMLQLGRGIQDFQAAGLMGVINNVEGLALALGLGSGIAGVATMAAVGVQVLLPQLKELADSFRSKEALEEAKAIEQLAEAGEKLKEKLQALAGAHSARAEAMQKENQAMERQIALEEQEQKNKTKAYEEETKRQVQAKAMEAAPSLEQQAKMPGEKARAEDIKKLVGGDPEAQRIKKAVEQAWQSQILHFEGRTGGWDKKDLEAEVKKRTDATLGQFYAGTAEGLQRVIRSLHPMLGNEGTLREQLSQLTPGAQMAQRGKDIMQTIRRFGDKARDQIQVEAKKRTDKAAREKKEKDDRLVDALNAEGQHNEILSDHQREQEKAAAGREAKQAEAKAARQEEQGMRSDMQALRQRIGQQRAAHEQAMGRQAQQMIFQQTGMAMDPAQALATVKQMQQQLAHAQQQGIGALMAVVQHQREQMMFWQQTARAARQMQQPLGNIGWY